jgi:hypothetical protein
MPELVRAIAEDWGSSPEETLHERSHSKQWPLQSVQVRLAYARIQAEDCADSDTKDGMVDRIDAEVSLSAHSRDSDSR